METPARIAIVDPDTRFWPILSRSLRGLQVQIETYRCAEVLLAEPSAGSLGCIVTEMELPGASGLDLIDELRRLDIQVPTIILTSQAELAGAVDAIRAGAIDYLQKPFVQNRVRDWVRRLIQLNPA